MDIMTQICDHILKENYTNLPTTQYKLFPDTKQLYNASNMSPYSKQKFKPTPEPKAKVKRNLNNSFSEAPDSNNKNSPHLNYSVISDNESNDSLVKRFRLSKTQPYVDLRRSNEIVDKIGALPETRLFSRTIKKTRRISFADDGATSGSAAQMTSSARRSARTVERKSYAELLSPEKIPKDILHNDYESYSLINGTEKQSPKKRLRSKSVDSNQYEQLKTISSTTVGPSPKKRNRPRRASVTQQSYKELFTDDDQDLYGSDSAFPSPIKRTRSKRKNKPPVRYTELSDTDIIEGVKELAMSDDEDNVMISSSSSPNKNPKVFVNTLQQASDLVIIGADEIELQKLENGKIETRKNFFADRWRTPRKTLRSLNKNSPKLDSPIMRYSPYKDHNPITPQTFNTIKIVDSPILHKSPSNIKTRKEIIQVPKTPIHVSKTPSRSDNSIINTTPKYQSKQSPQKSAANILRQMRAGVLTPTIQSRVTAVKGALTPLNKARAALHVSYVPDALPCREKEAEDIYGFVEGKLLDECGGCMYISGVPGTGKTATVTYVVHQLQNQSRTGKLPKFDYVSVNGMRLTEPRQSYVEIFKQLTGKIVPWEQAQNQLNSKFTKKGKASKPIVLLIDELDILCTKRQDVVYNLLDWPSKAYCQLIVVTIANTMDLPERLLMGRVTSRLGLTRLTFQAYNYKQLQEIVTKRLLDSKTFNPDAIQLVARKVASVSGDARRALDICRKAAEMAEINGKNTLVSMTHVNDAVDSMMTQPKIRAIKSSSRLQKLLLQSIVAEIERTGVEETTFSAVFKIFSSVAAIDGFAMVSMTIAMAAITKLGTCRLLLLDQKYSGLYQRIMLNVSVDDVYYALKSE